MSIFHDNGQGLCTSCGDPLSKHYQSDGRCIPPALKLPCIRFVVHTVFSNRDTNGNTYCFTRITSTMTGRSIVVDDLPPSNARQLIGRAAEVWNLSIDSEQTVPKKRWEAMKRGVEAKWMPDDEIMQAIRNLEKEGT